jgi:hypothetical protein
MIGDSLGLPKVFAPPGPSSLVFVHRHFSKVSDNNSPIPRDRVYYTFQYYSDAPLIRVPGSRGADIDMQAHRFGIEKTIFDGRASLELILPFQTSTASIITDRPLSVNGLSETEFGQLAFGTKAIAFGTDNSTLSVGLRVECPTDKDLGTESLRYETTAFYFTPYLGFVFNHEDWFFQGFVSHRIRGGELTRILAGSPVGAVRDPNQFSFDGGIGYWLYRDVSSPWLTGIVPTVELHYQWQTESESQPFLNELLYGDHVDMLNLSVGVTAILGHDITASLAWVAPMRSTTLRSKSGPTAGIIVPTDRHFEGEFVFQVNAHFGKK